jgi:hypothetical protein
MFGRILEDAHAVAGDERSARGARESLIRKLAETVRSEGPVASRRPGEVDGVHRRAES